MTRQAKTPAQRAQEQYDTACRVADRLGKKRAAARKQLTALQDEYDAAVVRRDYLAQHPDLPTQPTTPSKSGDTNA